MSDSDYTYFVLEWVWENMRKSIDMNKDLKAIMAEMKELKKVIVYGHIKQQAMEDKIFALESEKVEKKNVGEMEIEPEVQVSQVQLEPTLIDAFDSNRIRL